MKRRDFIKNSKMAVLSLNDMGEDMIFTQEVQNKKPSQGTMRLMSDYQRLFYGEGDYYSPLSLY